MDNNKQNPVENEFKSSTVYKTMTGSGIPVVDKIARGLSDAASQIDAAFAGVSPTAQKRVYNAQGTTVQQGQPVHHNAASPAANAGEQPSAAGHTNSGAYGQYRPQQGAPVHHNAPRENRGTSVSPAPAPQMKVKYTGSSVKFYLTGIAAVLYALIAPMSAPVHFIIFAVVLVLVFVLSSLVFRGRKQFIPIEPEEKKSETGSPAQEKRSKTGDPEVDRIIEEGTEYLKKLRAANDAIPDEALSDCIDRMEKASFDIFNYIETHPAQAPQIRRFMNYYLPTTLKLLSTYQRLSSQSVKGENVSSAMFNISGMMHTVADAFEKQLDSLFADEAMDVSADITVFEAMLKQEGFVNDKRKETNKE